MDAHGRQSQLPGMEILSGFRQASESTSPLKRLTTEYGGPESYPLVRGVNKSVVVHEVGRLDERGENYLRMRITTLRNNLRNQGSNSSDSTEPPTALARLSQAMSGSTDMGISR